MENRSSRPMQRRYRFWNLIAKDSDIQSSTSPSMNSKGFIQISTLVLVPLIASVFLGTLAVSWLIQEKQKIEMSCEKKALNAQRFLTTAANQLLLINPQAEILVAEKKFLQMAMRMAPTPAEKAALAAQLMIVLKKIAFLRAEQKQLIAGSEAKARTELLFLKKNLRSETRHIQKLWQSSPLTPFTSVTPPKVQLIPRFIDPMIPVYEIPPHFEKLQTLSVSFAMHGAQLFPPWLKFLWSKNFLWQETCSSKPEKGGRGWESHLGAAK